MAKIYTESDYFGGVDTRYTEYPYFSKRSKNINAQLGSYKNSKILIAGCGWGFLVRLLMRDYGFTDVWGCDASEYAVKTAAPREIPGYENRILLGDITSSTSMSSVSSAAGLKGTKKFAYIITEDVLPCLTDNEITTALSVLRGKGDVLGHIITAIDSNGVRQADGSVVYASGKGGLLQIADFNWKTPEEWRAIIGPTESIAYTHELEAII